MDTVLKEYADDFIRGKIKVLSVEAKEELHVVLRYLESHGLSDSDLEVDADNPGEVSIYKKML